MTPSKNLYAVNRLTALWALSESGLGGIMHAMKIPLTGFFVGGFAVVIIALIAHFSDKSMRAVLQSTLLVILVKAAVSPQSPFMAYIAVAFQGVTGALIFSFIPAFRPAALFFGFLALTESALQKFIVTTIIFGRSVWEALDIFMNGLLKDFHIAPDFSFSYWLILVFTLVHAVWGILLGAYAASIPGRIEIHSPEIIRRYRSGIKSHPVEAVIATGKKGKWLGLVMALVFTVSVLATSGMITQGLYVILRTIAIMLLLFMVIQPVTAWLLQSFEGKHKAKVEELVKQLPEIKNLVRPAYRLASENNNGLKKYRAFVFNLVVLSLMERDESEAL
jgi:hypothetical protein